MDKLCRCKSLSIYITHWVKEWVKENNGWKMFHLKTCITSITQIEKRHLISVSHVSSLLRYQPCEAIIRNWEFSESRYEPLNEGKARHLPS